MRKIIQISTDSQPTGADWNGWQVTTALCDDGTVWELEWKQEANQGIGAREWSELPAIPQENGEMNHE